MAADNSVSPNVRGRGRQFLRGLGLNALMIAITLAVAELALQWFTPAYLRMDDWHSLGYQYDAELGWFPVPSSTRIISLPRPVRVTHNSLGLRDVEPEKDERPTILFLGDSFVWGYNVEDHERFTNLLRLELPAYRSVNAGVSGYGTDQQFLLMRRIWDRIKPDIVILMFCVDNDRQDNASNVRYFSYKPYLQTASDGGWQVAGQPPPKSRRTLFAESPLAHTFMLARLAISAYVEIRYPRVTIPDPTERLIDIVREFVESRGAAFVVGVQRSEPRLESYLRQKRIPYATFEDAELYDSSRHWTPEGNRLVAQRLLALLAETGLLNDRQPSQRVNP